jgi:hypothetical protein
MIDWPSCNESLVRSGQVLLDYDVLDGWDNELSQMNQSEVGEPYAYPDSFIQLLGYMRAYFHLPYRQTQGVVVAHSSTKVPCIPDYITISRACKQTRYQNQREIRNRYCHCFSQHWH